MGCVTEISNQKIFYMISKKANWNSLISRSQKWSNISIRNYKCGAILGQLLIRLQKCSVVVTHNWLTFGQLGLLPMNWSLAHFHFIICTLINKFVKFVRKNPTMINQISLKLALISWKNACIRIHCTDLQQERPYIHLSY